jgi:hypothetical protein
MKTTNKLILGLLAVILILVTVLMISLKLNIDKIETIEGSGNMVTDTRPMDVFSRINVAGNFKVMLEQGDNHGVTIDTDDNFLPFISTEVVGNELIIKFDQKTYLHKQIDVYITFSKLDELSMTAGANTETVTTLNGQTIKMLARAGAMASLSLNYDEVHLDALAGSMIDLAGTAKKLTVESNAGAQIRAGDFIVEVCKISANAGSQNDIYVTQNLDASASSGSQIRFAGNPEVKNISTSSGGNVSPR